jgi:hypothetical protein
MPSPASPRETATPVSCGLFLLESRMSSAVSTELSLRGKAAPELVPVEPLCVSCRTDTHQSHCAACGNPAWTMAEYDLGSACLCGACGSNSSDVVGLPEFPATGHALGRLSARRPSMYGIVAAVRLFVHSSDISALFPAPFLGQQGASIASVQGSTLGWHSNYQGFGVVAVPALLHSVRGPLGVDTLAPSCSGCCSSLGLSQGWLGGFFGSEPVPMHGLFQCSLPSTAAYFLVDSWDRLPQTPPSRGYEKNQAHEWASIHDLPASAPATWSSDYCSIDTFVLH